MRLGISDRAQRWLGEVFWCELPTEGRSFKRHEVIATLEGMQHLDEGGAGDEWVEEDGGAGGGIYGQPGWQVDVVNIRNLGNMRTVTRQVFAPADCVVVESNPRLEAQHGLANTSAEAEGWLVRLKLSDDPPQLMDSSEYERHAESLGL